MDDVKENTSQTLNEISLELNEFQKCNDIDDITNMDGSIDPEINLLNKISAESYYYDDEALNNTLKNNEGLSIFHFNARSLNANFGSIDMYLSQLDSNPDIITISETWFSEHTNISTFNIRGYNMDCVSREDCKGGGVAIYIKQDLRYKKLESKCLSIADCFECINVKILLKGSKNIIIACIYRKPDSKIDEFTIKLEELYGNLRNNKIVYITGDINIDLFKHESHYQTKYFIDTMYSMGLYPLITKPSRITGHSATLIDNIFTNEAKHENISGLIINDITDHLPIFTIFKYKIKKHIDKSIVQQRKIDNECLNKLKNELEHQNWQAIYSQKDVNKCYCSFKEKFEDILNNACPLEIKQFKHRRKSKPWLTCGLINACKKKNRLYKKFLETKLDSDENTYKAYKNKLTKILKNAEKAYYNGLIEQQKHDIKATWKVLNTVIRGVACPSKIPEMFLENNIEIKDTKDIANGFNRFFVNVGPKLAQGIQRPSHISA